jgi:UDPglucose 6-dehydrogenase
MESPKNIVINAKLATRLCFMNEIANNAERLGAIVEHIQQAIRSDTRIGHQFIYLGCVYGGGLFS